MANRASTTVRLTLSYDGTDFKGWARQGARVRTLEGEILPILQQVAGEPIRISVAGRTDAGVHARGQVISFQTPTATDPQKFASIINGFLGPEVVVVDARRAPDGFDARHSAVAREYRYRIDTGAVPDPFTARFTWHRADALSVTDMRAAALLLIGSHDFSSFGLPTSPGGSPIRRLQRLAISRDGDVVTLTVRGNAFLRHMVRSLVGTLVEVGSGKRPSGSLNDVLAARSRNAAAKPAPPSGLTLTRVTYR